MEHWPTYWICVDDFDYGTRQNCYWFLSWWLLCWFYDFLSLCFYDIKTLWTGFVAAQHKSTWLIEWNKLIFNLSACSGCVGTSVFMERLPCCCKTLQSNERRNRATASPAAGTSRPSMSPEGECILWDRFAYKPCFLLVCVCVCVHPICCVL